MNETQNQITTTTGNHDAAGSGVAAGKCTGRRYGAQDVNDDPPPCLNFADQSGFGFEGVYGTNMPTDGTSFKLGTFTHYNSVTNVDLADYNPLENVRLTITLSGSVNAALQYIITLVETVNDDDPCMVPDAPNDPPCGEKVKIASEPLQTTILAIEGEQYTLEVVGFTDCDVPGTPTKTSTPMRWLPIKPACMQRWLRFRMALDIQRSTMSVQSTTKKKPSPP